MSDRNNNKDDEVAIPPDPKLLRRRDTIYEDILGMMVRETEEGVKRSMKLQTVLEHDEHRRRLPYQLFKKHLNKVIHEVHFTNGVTNFDKDVKYCQFVNKPTQVSCIGVDKNNLDCGENVILDIDSESTKLPFFCKVMIVNQGRVHERSAPTLVRDVCLQIGDSITEKIFQHLRHSALHHTVNMHNMSMNTSRFLEFEMHAVDDPNVSFTTPRSTRVRRPSWCLMEEYYSIPFYQYRGKEKVRFQKGVNTYVSMGYTVEEADSLYSSFNSNPINTTVTTNQAVDTDDLFKHVNSTTTTTTYSLNDVKGGGVVVAVTTEHDKSNSNINNNQNQIIEIAHKPPLPSLTTPIKRKRNKLIHLVFTDQYTNTTSIPVSQPSVTDVIVKPKPVVENKDNSITVVMPGTPRDISIRYDDDDDNNKNEEVYYVKDATTDTNDLINHFRLDEIRPKTPINALPFQDDYKDRSKINISPAYSRPTPSYIISETLVNEKENNTNKKTENVEENDPAKRSRKKYNKVETTENILKDSLLTPTSNAFGRILRQRYFKKTTGKEPMRFDTLIPFSPRVDNNYSSTANNLQTNNITNNIITSDDLEQDRNKEKTPTQTILQSTPNAKEKARVRDSSLKNHSPTSARLSTKPPTSARHTYKRPEDEKIRTNREIDDTSRFDTSNDLEEENSDNELERLVNYYIKQDHIRKLGGARSRQSNDALSISTIEPGDNILHDPPSNINNSIDFEIQTPNEALRNSLIRSRATSAYPDYSRYPLITRALNKFDQPSGQNDLNRSVPTVPPRAHSHDSDIVKSSSFIVVDNNKNNNTSKHEDDNNNYRLTYSIRPQPTADYENTNRSVRHKKKNRDIVSQSFHEYNRDSLLKSADNDVNRSYCPKCLRESLRQENELQHTDRHHHQEQDKLQEKENVYSSDVTTGVDLERRIAHLIEAENDNARYLIRTFVSPTVSRPQTSRSLNTSRSFNRPTKVGITGNHLLVENPINNLLFSEATKRKIEKYKQHHKNYPSSEQKYYRIRHDRTLHLYEEPIPVDVLRQNFEDFATVTAAAAQSLSESGILLKQMNNLLTTAAEI